MWLKWIYRQWTTRVQMHSDGLWYVDVVPSQTGLFWSSHKAPVKGK